MLAEQAARQTIDKLLSQAGWAVQTVARPVSALSATRGTDLERRAAGTEAAS
jgi:type I site-specific restriction endonuclease